MAASRDSLAAEGVVVPSRPARVLHVHSGNLYGGVETFLVNLIRYGALASSMTTAVALVFEGWLSRELAAAGLQAHLLGYARARRPWTVLAARRVLASVLATEGYDLVVTHSPWAHALFAPSVRASGIGLVYHLHEDPNPRGWLDWWANGTVPDLVLCNSKFTQSRGKWLFPTRERHVVYPPLRPDPTTRVSRREMRGALGAGEGDVVILHASRLEPWKGHELLIAALAEIRDDPRWVCWIAGGPQREREIAYEQSLHRRARTLGIGDRVHFLGQRADVPALMRAADIHCQSNVGPEPFGQVFVEALAAGLPVVTTDMGGGREIVTDACGLRVDPRKESVAVALRRLIADPALRASFAKEGPRRARAMCDPERRLRQLEQLLVPLTDGRRRSTSRSDSI